MTEVYVVQRTQRGVKLSSVFRRTTQQLRGRRGIQATPFKVVEFAMSGGLVAVAVDNRMNSSLPQRSGCHVVTGECREEFHDAIPTLLQAVSCDCCCLQTHFRSHT